MPGEESEDELGCRASVESASAGPCWRAKAVEVVCVIASGDWTQSEGESYGLARI